MKAQVAAKAFERKRVKLETVLPIDTPFAIILETSSYCDLQCVFCVHGDKNATQNTSFRYGHMDFDLFKKIVDDAADFNKQIKKLKLCGMGECLLHKQLPQMIEYAKKSGAFEVIDLFTNGVALSPELNRKLVDAGLDWVNISVNGLNGEQYEKNCGRQIDFEKYVDNIRDLYENKGGLTMYVKLGDNGYSDEDKQRFYDVFGNICDKIFIETIVDNAWPGAELDTPDIGKNFFGEVIEQREVCDLIFTRMTIGWDGRVRLCGADWKSEFSYGDAKKQSLKELWNGPELRRIYMMQLKKQKDQYAICKGCEKYLTCTPDNIDPYAEDLLKRYEAIEN